MGLDGLKKSYIFAPFLAPGTKSNSPSVSNQCNMVRFWLPKAGALAEGHAVKYCN